jgi:hypothetical protein
VIKTFGFRNALIVVACFAMSACASKVLKADNADERLSSKEFDNAVQIKDLAPDDSNVSGTFVKWPGPPPVAGAFPHSSVKSGKGDSKKATKKRGGTLSAAQPASPGATPAPAATQALAALAAATGTKHEPSMEDGQGFVGRRPVKDPFRVGEKVTMDVSYFNVVAGSMTVEVRNFAEVNGRKSYRMAGTAKSTSVFAMFYAVEDWFETFVDFETLVPQSYALHVKETKQLRETRTVFDWATHKANYYDKKINDEKKLEEENKQWDIPEFSQNVFSTVFYLRTFDIKPGFKTQFRVAHEGKNLVLGAEYVRKEKITTAAGDFNCVVVKPSISLDGKFTPIGDIFVWFTDDDRKLLVRIESKIKIGKIIGVAKSIDLGKP